MRHGSFNCLWGALPKGAGQNPCRTCSGRSKLLRPSDCQKQLASDRWIFLIHIHCVYIIIYIYSYIFENLGPTRTQWFTINAEGFHDVWSCLKVFGTNVWQSKMHQKEESFAFRWCTLSLWSLWVTPLFIRKRGKLNSKTKKDSSSKSIYGTRAKPTKCMVHDSWHELTFFLVIRPFAPPATESSYKKHVSAAVWQTGSCATWLKRLLRCISNWGRLLKSCHSPCSIRLSQEWAE